MSYLAMNNLNIKKNIIKKESFESNKKIKNTI